MHPTKIKKAYKDIRYKLIIQEIQKLLALYEIISRKPNTFVGYYS
jgi:hypothetical protein